jgi:ribose 5-phosphate isomerase B
VLALSLRATSAAELGEILDAWFGGSSSTEPDDIENIAHVAEIERSG